MSQVDCRQLINELRELQCQLKETPEAERAFANLVRHLHSRGGCFDIAGDFVQVLAKYFTLSLASSGKVFIYTKEETNESASNSNNDQ